MTEYSVEEVRAEANKQAQVVNDNAARQLRAYANILEQIERAREGVTDEVVDQACFAAINRDPETMARHVRLDYHEQLAFREVMRAALQSVAHLLPSGERAVVEEIGEVAKECIRDLRKHAKQCYNLPKLADDLRRLANRIERKMASAANPPAQAAQATKRPDDVSVDGLRAKCAAIAANRDYWFGEAEWLRMALYEATHQAVPAPTAEPVVQAEGDKTLKFEEALAELIEAVDPSIENGDILADAHAAALVALQRREPVPRGDAAGEVTKLVQRIKGFSGVHLKEGTGATDALYDLAVKHGASEAVAAGFAHSANGEMNELQSCVYTIAQLALNLAAQPRAVPDVDAKLTAGIRGLLAEIDHPKKPATDPTIKLIAGQLRHLLAAAPQPGESA